MEQKNYKVIQKSQMSGKRFSGTYKYKSDKEAIENNKGCYGLEIWKRIY